MARALSLSGLKAEIQAVEGFNTKLAILVTRGVGTMACAYLFCAIALIGLPSAIQQATSGQGPLPIVQWVAQTFLQLVLLSVIMVGQNVQNIAADARTEKQTQDLDTVVDRLDTRTQGGITEVLAAVKALAEGGKKDAR